MSRRRAPVIHMHVYAAMRDAGRARSSALRVATLNYRGHEQVVEKFGQPVHTTLCARRSRWSRDKKRSAT